MPLKEIIEGHVHALYERVFNEGEVDKIPCLFSETYIQHNPLFPDGTEVLVNFLKAEGSLPCEIKRICICGHMVFVHVFYPKWMGKGHAAVDIFRVDDDGRFAEHWDVLQEIPSTSANGNTMF